MNNRGFTLVELLVTIVIITIVVGISLITGGTFIAKNKLNNQVIAAKQIIQEAQNYAKTKSESIKVVFNTNSVSIQDLDSNEINRLDFEDNIYYDATSSTISSNQITFNFKGSPIGSNDEPTSFTASQNEITICYKRSTNSDCEFTKDISVMPITGIPKSD
ncbi:MAG: prepilin-type N-terminal cleavage/methylation domain-containing protein [Vampirovibrionia bacterium]